MQQQLLSKVIRTALVTSALLVAIGAGQLAQIQVTLDDLDNNAIATWKAAHKADAGLADSFVDQCLEPKVKALTKEELDKGPVTIFDCADRIGASAIAARMRENRTILTSAAWPLSMVLGAE